MTGGRLILRTYKMGFGDSFLILSYKDGHRYSILVDLGNKQGCNCGCSLEDVIDNINRTLKGEPLDVLIVSHTHRDHIRGLCPSNTKEGRFDNSPREIWVPRNCDPNYGPKMRYKRLISLDGCNDKLQRFANTIGMALRIKYLRNVDSCLDRIENLYPSAQIRYMDNCTPIQRVYGFNGEFTLDILNPPTKPKILLRSILNLVPKTILEECQIPSESIMMIKGLDEFVKESNLEEDLRATGEDFDEFVERREETVSKFEYREIPPSQSQIDEIEIDEATKRALRKVAEIVCKGKVWVLQEEEVNSFYNLLDELNRIGHIHRGRIKGSIERMESKTANDFSLVTQIRWQGNTLLFPGDLQDWSGIRNRIYSIDILKVPHHGGEGTYLWDTELLSRMFPTHGCTSIIPTCYPEDDCSAKKVRPDPIRAFNILRAYTEVIPTSKIFAPYMDSVFVERYFTPRLPR